jgi:hypothetical protein
MQALKLEENKHKLKHLRNTYYLLLFFMPVLILLFTLDLWIIIKKNVIIPTIIVCSIYALYALSLLLIRKSYYKYAKYFLFLLFTGGTFLAHLFWTYIPVPIAFSYLPIKFFIVYALLLTGLNIYLYYYYYKYWNKVWNANKKFNEAVAFDLINGVYDVERQFKWDERKIEKRRKKKVTVLSKIIDKLKIAAFFVLYSLVGAGPAVGAKLHRSGEFGVIAIILSTLSPILGFYFLKISIGPFVGMKKVIEYEKLIGKPIRNYLPVEQKNI